MEETAILITGASSDIGSQLAGILAGKKRLILQGRSEESLEKLKLSLQNSDSHMIWIGDLLKTEALAENLLYFLQKNNTKVSDFIHVAGICDMVPLRLATEKRMAASFAVNFFSATEIISTLLKKAFKPCLKNIVFVSTVAVLGGGNGLAAYGASKGSLEAYARSAAMELAPDIRVNCVAPGVVLTKNIERYNQDKIDDLGKRHPLGIGSPEDIAKTVEFLLSDKARWITGQIMRVDGGYSIVKF